VHYPLPLNQQPVFDCGFGAECTPISAAIAQRVLSLPMHPYLTDDAQDRIIAAVAEITGLT
jgi:UDP-2-acetamido-2-deoxy-ribo-hexuluronate aminotransferase